MRVSCDTIQEKGKEEEGGGRKGVLGKEDRETERAHRRAALGGLMTFCSSLARAPRMQGPAGQWPAGVCGTLQKWAAEVSRGALDAGGCAGRRWMGTGDAQAQALQGRNRLQAGEQLSVHWDTHSHSHPDCHPPLAHTSQAQARGLQSPPGRLQIA